MALVSAQPIAAGYAYGLRLTFDGGAPPFPDGCVLRAEVRDYAGAPKLAGLMTSENGTVTVVDDRTVELFLSPALTGALGRTTCAIDLVRTDQDLAAWLGFQLVMPVATTVTRSTADSLAPQRVSSGLTGSVLATVLAPLGVIVSLGLALGMAPWSLPQVIAAGSVVGQTAVAIPTLSLSGTGAIGPAPIQPTSRVFSPSGFPELLSVQAGPLIGSPSIPSPSAALQAAQQLATLPPPPPTVIPGAVIGLQAPIVIGDVGTGVATLIGSPLLTTDGTTTVLGPAAIASATAILKPALSQSSPSSYVADGYVDDGYVGAS